MHFPHRLSSSTTVLSLALLSAIGLSGCSSSLTSSLTAAEAHAVTGNWQVSSTAASASRLAKLSGSLSGTELAVTGVFHAGSSTACVAPTTPIQVTGHADANNVLTLTGKVAGGTLTIAGTLAEDGKSLIAATYNVAGGSCAFPAQVAATAQSFNSVTGTYAGSFSNSGGQVITISASLTQTPESDTDGNFQLSGTGTFPNNPCFSSPVSISNSQVTGGSFTLTYADPTTQNSVTASGTFSTDASALTVTNWTLTGSCGPDTGTGQLTR